MSEADSHSDKLLVLSGELEAAANDLSYKRSVWMRFERMREAAKELRGIAELHVRLKESEAYAESLAKDICAMEDALGFKNDCTDKDGAFVPTIGPWLERVRDLIAVEGELGDAKEKLQAYEQAMEREKKPDAKE